MKRAILFGLFFSCLAVFTRAQDPAIFIVRHAERSDSPAGSPAATPADPALSDAGRARAAALAVVLKDAQITAIYATEFKRTQLTALPLARAMGLGISTIPAKDTAALIAKLKGEQGNVLVVTHSNTIPEIIKGLGISTPVEVAESDYDNLFVVLTGHSSHLLHLHYH